MSMSAGGSSGGVQSDINVTPMIDVLLVLLIIFMITQPLSRMALDVQVPPPDEPVTTKTPPSQIVLELADDGSYTINGQPVPKDQLDTQIHAIYDQRPAKLLFIKAGANRLYPGSGRGHGRRPGRRGPDHRLHAEGSEREVGVHAPSTRAGTGFPVPARAFGRRPRVSGAMARRRPLSFAADAPARIPRDSTRAPSPPRLALPASRRRYGALLVSVLLHTLLIALLVRTGDRLWSRTLAPVLRRVISRNLFSSRRANCTSSIRSIRPSITAPVLVRLFPKRAGHKEDLRQVDPVN